MKRRAFLFALAFTFLKCSAQSWFPVGAEWYYRFIPAGIAAEGHVRVVFFRDTLVGGLASRELQVFQTLGEVQPPFGHSTDQLESLFVSEQEGLILLYNSEDALFDTLYNMSAAPGDQWVFPELPDWMNCAPMSTFTVLDTGTQVIDDIQLHWLSLDLYYDLDEIAYSRTDTILERVGCLQTFFYPQDQCLEQFDANVGGPLTCYFDEEVSYGPGQPEDLVCAFLPNAILDHKLDPFSLSPNPSNGPLRIEMAGLVPIGSTLSVFNTRGQLAATRSLRQQTTTVDLFDLPAGPYFIQIRTDGAIHTQVWMKE